jgi:hypothetical protein
VQIDSPPTVGTMKICQTAYVGLNAIEIDANWGVWIDPKAKVASQQSASTPITVEFLNDGYTVNMMFVFNSQHKAWDNNLAHSSFTGKGFVPVAKVN